MKFLLKSGIFFSILLAAILFLNFQEKGPEIKIFELNDQHVKVTHQADPSFYGHYRGARGGYLLLHEDGTGEYLYDVFGIHPEDCEPGVIKFEWGFILDENNRLVVFERDYGLSYPVIYQCVGKTCFQGCSRTFMVDYILDKNDGRLVVSSSDDWVKIIQ